MPPDVDPLSKALEPPPDESPEERTARIQAEADAKRVSDMIDEQLESERAAVKKGPKALKAFKKERAAWKAVIQLNVVRSIHLILDALTRAQAEARNSSSSSSRNAPPQISQELLKLQRRLAPLLQVEQALIRRLAPVGAGEAEKTLSNPNSSYADRSKNMVKEIVINSGYGSGWRSALTRFLGGDGQESRDTEPPVDWNDPNDPGVVLSACRQDMVTLWADPAVRAVLYRQKLRLEDMAGFFLDCIERVTAVDYVPSDDDVLRARLKTVGISEHRFSISSAHGAAWVPYFDDMDAIIFLAPISAFDQKLAEDPDINRLVRLLVS
ncbi:hypothetical protein H0H81_010996 [Sphagnurus paluster]|uniref:Uncharacterized protein n=1 Tax=Sphagnurus paluster TaxID=117069 RepID=A0A9P7GN81_9AGAR|nr:hypothetical protein H0H81_010996 [Sphagnurus paluster]